MLMAFPTQTMNQQDALNKSIRKAETLKTYLADASVVMGSQTVSASLPLGVMSECMDALMVWNKAKAVSGIGQYAKDQFADQNLNIGAEFTAMVNAVQAVVDAVDTHIPKDADGYLLVRKIVNGSFVVRQLSVAETADIVAAIDACINTIE